MVYENTHLFAANARAKEIGFAELSSILDINIDFYRLGAIFPDTLSYAAEDKTKQIASVLHCKKAHHRIRSFTGYRAKSRKIETFEFK